jgi:hypothetical protein
MKTILLLIILIVHVCLTQAQRFFYVETGNMAEKSIKEDLLKASQHVTKSPLMSDYTIKTELGFQTESKTATLKIILQDSATFQTIFQAKEEYAFGVVKVNPQILLSMAMKTLIEKNINQIILCAKDDHYHSLMKLVELKKDKTLGLGITNSKRR